MHTHPSLPPIPCISFPSTHNTDTQLTHIPPSHTNATAPTQQQQGEGPTQPTQQVSYQGEKGWTEGALLDWVMSHDVPVFGRLGMVFAAGRGGGEQEVCNIMSLYVFVYNMYLWCVLACGGWVTVRFTHAHNS